MKEVAAKIHFKVTVRRYEIRSPYLCKKKKHRTPSVRTPEKTNPVIHGKHVGWDEGHNDPCYSANIKRLRSPVTSSKEEEI